MDSIRRPLPKQQGWDWSVVLLTQLSMCLPSPFLPKKWQYLGTDCVLHPRGAPHPGSPRSDL